jgi:hypothetical protein
MRIEWDGLMRQRDNDETRPWHFSLRTLLVAVFIAAVVAAGLARLAPISVAWFGIPLVLLNLVLLISGAGLFCCKSNELRSLGLGCWLFMIPLLAATIGLISVGEK